MVHNHAHTVISPAEINRSIMIGIRLNVSYVFVEIIYGFKNNSTSLFSDAYVSLQSDYDWETKITTKEFGTKTKAEAFVRIVSHTAYHAGQIAIILKYGHH